MTPKNTVPAKPQSAAPAAARNAVTAASPSTGRKPWIKKTPVGIVLEQIGKQEQKVAEMREAISHEERELSKLQQAKKILEST